MTAREPDVSTQRPPLREVTQLFLAGRADGIPGDCVRAAVAALFDREPVSVPHFIASSEIDGRVWWYALQGWAHVNGWTVTRRGLLPHQQDVPLPRFGLAFGPSERGISHAVVAVDGKVVWDPHPSRAGILRVNEIIEFEPVEPGGPETFAWGESIGANGKTGAVDIPVNRGDEWIGDIRLGLDDARVLHDMLGNAVDEIAKDRAAEVGRHA